jgi:predicted O-methyltransferase YrrM
MPLRYMVDGQLAEPDRVACAHVEELRSRLAARAGETVSIYYSPKPGTAGDVATAEMRPEHGEIQTFDLDRIANQTSVGAPTGRMMYLAGKGSGAKTIVELGACAGIASAYLASSGCTRFVGIEGSKELADIARGNATAVKPDAEIIHGLFDDALDEHLESFTDGIDMAWIDGHHEKVATIHYFQRLQPKLNPGALVFFDDIRWSQDMFDGWEILRRDTGFSDAIDVGNIGVGVWAGGGNHQPRQFDVASLGHGKAIGTPHGWK